MCPVCIVSSAAVIVSGLISAGGTGGFAIRKARVLPAMRKPKPPVGAPRRSSDCANRQEFNLQEGSR